MRMRTYDGEEATRDGGGGDEGQNGEFQYCLGVLVLAKREQQLDGARTGPLGDGHVGW